MVGTPQESSRSNLTQYLGDLEQYLGRDVNRKYGKLEVELAVDGWVLATNTKNDAASIESSLAWAGRNRGLETRVEQTAYITPPEPRVINGYVAIYKRGEGVNPRVPTEVVEEARDYLSKDRGAQLAFLRGFYQQIVLGKEGTYAERFNARKGEIATVSNYFADKIRDLGLDTLADKLEAKIKEKFPGQEKNFKKFISSKVQA